MVIQKKDKYSNDNSEKDIFLCAGELNEIGLQPLYDILEMLELPKSFPTKETIQNFNLGRTLALAQRHLSQDILVSVSIVKESTNTTSASTENINVFKVSSHIINMHNHYNFPKMVAIRRRQ